MKDVIHEKEESARPVGFGSACPTCGAKHDEIIKRLRGIIYTVIAPKEHDQLIANMHRKRCTYAEVLAQHGFTKVELNPVPGTQGPFYCTVCMPDAIIEHRKQKRKTDELKNQLGLF